MKLYEKMYKDMQQKVQGGERIKHIFEATEIKSGVNRLLFLQRVRGDFVYFAPTPPIIIKNQRIGRDVKYFLPTPPVKTKSSTE